MAPVEALRRWEAVRRALPAAPKAVTEAARQLAAEQGLVRAERGRQPPATGPEA
jgi:hypothetical protein